MEFILPLFLLMETLKKHAFVTGASGFVGAHLVCALLGKGYTVTALVRSSGSLSAFYSIKNIYPYADTSAISWIEGDLLSAEDWIGSIKSVDVVFHAAAMVSFLSKHKKEMMETNIQGKCLPASQKTPCICVICC